MKVALVHDHLTQYGGAERVLEAFQAIWPEAPTFTLLYDENAVGDSFSHRDIRTSFLQKMPFAIKKSRWYLPLMTTATESYDLSNYDIVISSSSAFSKGVITTPNTIHICYCHTPTRYLWSDTHSYIKELRAPKIVKMFLYPILSKLRVWDRLSAERVDYFVANSENIKNRIMKYYQKSSDVIFPPVDIDEFTISDKKKEYYLIGGRLVSYKRYDIVVEAFNKTGLPLKIFGSGPEEKKLRRIAKQNIQFLGRVSNDERARLFSNAIAFLHPQEEDFGITPIESMAAGRPVIAYRRGGAVETVIDGKTGILFDEQSAEAIANICIMFDENKFDPEYIRNYAKIFSLNKFREEFYNYVDNKWKNHRKKIIGLL